MPLKVIVNKTEYDGLAEPLKEYYRSGNGDDEFILDADIPNTTPLKNTIEHVKAERKKAREEAKTLKAQLATIEKDKQKAIDKAIKEKGDVEALDKSWKQKYANRETELKGRITVMETSLQGQMRDSVAQGLAKTLAGKNAALLLPHLKQRLKGEFVDGKAVTKVLDANGDISASTIEDLSNEFLTNDAFKVILVGSKGGGTGGAGDLNPSPGGMTLTRLKEMGATKAAQWAIQNPQANAKLHGVNLQDYYPKPKQP